MRPSRLLVALVLVTAATTTTACAPDRAAPGLTRVKLGMTPAQVEAIAGRPADRLAAPCMDASPLYYVYAGTGAQLESYVYFVGERVVQVVERHRTLTSAPADQLAACGARPATGG